jgi:hypothetical protein
MGVSRWREMFLPWSLDSDLWEPRLGAAALRTYRAASWAIAVGFAWCLLMVVSLLLPSEQVASWPDSVYWLVTLVRLSGLVCILALALLVQAFDRSVAELYGMPTATMRSLRPRQLRDPVLFDQWTADHSPVAPAP